MKILIDNNISFRVVALFDNVGVDSKHVSYYKMEKNTEDNEIWKFAKA